MHKSVCHTQLLPLGLILSISCLPLCCFQRGNLLCFLDCSVRKSFTLVSDNMSVECIFYLAPEITGLNKQHLTGLANSVFGEC